MRDELRQPRDSRQRRPSMHADRLMYLATCDGGQASRSRVANTMRTNTGSTRLTRGVSEVSNAILPMMGPIAQRSEPPAHNRSVPGSNPGGPTTRTEGEGAARTHRLSTLRRTGTRRAQWIARNGGSAMASLCPALRRGFFLPIPQHLY